MPVLFLELVEGLEVSVEVLSIIVPRVPRIVDLLVCPRVRQKDFSRIRFQICKGIEYVAIYVTFKFVDSTTKNYCMDARQVLYRNQRGWEFASVDAPT